MFEKLQQKRIPACRT